MSERPLLVLDTATRTAVVARADADGTLRDEDAWLAGYRHGEELLVRVAALLARGGTTLAGVGGIVVGTGPGAFTGLRVGLATAKGLAHAARLPVAGVSTAEALLRAAGLPRPVLLLPAGPSDRVLCRPGGPPRLLSGGTEVELAPDEALLAVDLEGRAPDAAVAAGQAARTGLAGALAALGARRLADGGDDLARLVPEYVTLPRGVVRDAPDGSVHVAGSG